MLPHLSVLLKECLFYFDDKKLSTFMDGTLGAGGHAEAILTQHPEIQKFIGIDQDFSAIEIARKRLLPFEKKIFFFQNNFSEISKVLRQANVEKIDGILVDLGVSSMQLDTAEKGFSFLRQGPLDMRMDQRQTLTAEEIVNHWEEKDIARILRDYGEEKKWRKVAEAIVRERKKKPINTTLDLVELLEPILRDPPWVKKSKIHPLTKTFQALRIAVNRELEALELFLKDAVLSLNKGGRLAVITFHSLEDRIVKHFFRNAESDKVSTSGIGGMFINKEPLVRILTRKPIEASEEEIAANPRSRSAKLRVIEKL